MNGRIDESVHQWFGHIERMGNDRIAERVNVGECVESRLLSWQQNRWIDSMNDYLKERDLNVGQERRKMYDRNEK